MNSGFTRQQPTTRHNSLGVSTAQSDQRCCRLGVTSSRCGTRFGPRGAAAVPRPREHGKRYPRRSASPPTGLGVCEGARSQYHEPLPPDSPRQLVPSIRTQVERALISSLWHPVVSSSARLRRNARWRFPGDSERPCDGKKLNLAGLAWFLIGFLWSCWTSRNRLAPKLANTAATARRASHRRGMSLCKNDGYRSKRLRRTWASIGIPFTNGSPARKCPPTNLDGCGSSSPPKLTSGSRAAMRRRMSPPAHLRPPPNEKCATTELSPKTVASPDRTSHLQ